MRFRLVAWAALGVLGLTVTACERGDEAESLTGPRSPGITRAVGAPVAAIPDASSDPSGFVAAVGERVIVCKHGPTAAAFDVTDDQGGSSVIEVRPGRCAVAYEAGGATRTVTVQERVPHRQRVEGVLMTQLTCGRGVGVLCDPSSFPVIQGPSAASNPVSGLVGGTGPADQRSQWGLSGYVVEFSNSFIPSDAPPRGEHVIVCLRNSRSAKVLVTEGGQTTQVDIQRGCQSVFSSGGETRSVTVQQIVPRGQRLAQTFYTQLTCGRGLGVQCGPSFPVVQGPTSVSDPVTGFVGGTGPTASPSQLGLSGFLVEYWNVPR